MTMPQADWKVPRYIAEGLHWLEDQLIVVEADAAEAVPTTETEAAT